MMSALLFILSSPWSGYKLSVQSWPLKICSSQPSHHTVYVPTLPSIFFQLSLPSTSPVSFYSRFYSPYTKETAVILSLLLTNLTTTTTISYPIVYCFTFVPILDSFVRDLVFILEGMSMYYVRCFRTPFTTLL